MCNLNIAFVFIGQCPFFFPAKSTYFFFISLSDISNITVLVLKINVLLTFQKKRTDGIEIAKNNICARISSTQS